LKGDIVNDSAPSAELEVESTDGQQETAEETPQPEGEIEKQADASEPVETPEDTTSSEEIEKQQADASEPVETPEAEPDTSSEETEKTE